MYRVLMRSRIYYIPGISYETGVASGVYECTGDGSAGTKIYSNSSGPSLVPVWSLFSAGVRRPTLVTPICAKRFHTQMTPTAESAHYSVGMHNSMRADEGQKRAE